MEFRVSNIVKTVYSDTILPLKQFYACLDSIVVVLVIVFVRCTRAVLFSLAFVFCFVCRQNYAKTSQHTFTKFDGKVARLVEIWITLL